MPRRCRWRASPRRSARRSTSIRPASLTARYRAFADAFAPARPLICYRRQGKFEPGGAAPLRRARGRRRCRLGRRIAPRAGRRRSAAAHRLLRGRQDARTSWPRRSPPASTRSMSSRSPSCAGSARWRRQRGATARVAIRVNPDVDAHDPRQDLDRQEGEQVRHRHRRGGRRLSAGRGACRASSRSGSRCISARRPAAVSSRSARPSSGSPSWSSNCAGPGLPVRRVDLGGGLGIRYHTETPPEPRRLRDAGARRCSARSMSRSPANPAGCCVGPAGLLVASVIYVKDGASKRFVILDAAMNDLIRPALYDAWHDIVPVRLPAPRRGARPRPTSSARSARPATPSPSTASCRRWPKATWSR